MSSPSRPSHESLPPPPAPRRAAPHTRRDALAGHYLRRKAWPRRGRRRRRGIMSAAARHHGGAASWRQRQGVLKGGHSVAGPVWPGLCGRACVAGPVWPGLCGRACVAGPVWPGLCAAPCCLGRTETPGRAGSNGGHEGTCTGDGGGTARRGSAGRGGPASESESLSRGCGVDGPRRRNPARTTRPCAPHF